MVYGLFNTDLNAAFESVREQLSKYYPQLLPINQEKCFMIYLSPTDPEPQMLKKKKC